MTKTHRVDPAPFLVRPGAKVRLQDHDPAFTGGFRDKAHAKESLLEDVTLLAEAQDRLWAGAVHSVIVIFQAMDAAGKDSAIKHVMSGVNPQGCEVHCFKAPSDEELRHHYLWRPMRATPGRGRIAIYNRSYYEEVLVVRVHPEFLKRQVLPNGFREKNIDKLWKIRYEEINSYERLLSHHGTLVLKFFLHVSREEQRLRFLERITNPEKNWKFNAGDVRERQHWDEYMRCYEEMLSATSTEHAPWYVIPADKKWFTRACVADIITTRIDELNPQYPRVSDEQRRELDAMRGLLEQEAI